MTRTNAIARALYAKMGFVDMSSFIAGTLAL